MRVQRLEPRVIDERVAGFVPEIGEGGREPRAARFVVDAEIVIQRGEHPHAGRRRLRPVDERERFERGHILRDAGRGDRRSDAARSEQARRVGVQRIPEQPGRGRIGREVVGVRSEERVRGAQRQRVGAAQAARRAQGLDARERADAAIACRAQSIDLRREAPDRRAPRHVGGGKAARRRDRENRLRVADEQAMVSCAMNRVGAQKTVGVFVQANVLRVAVLEDDARVRGLQMIGGNEQRFARARNNHRGKRAGDRLLHQARAALRDVASARAGDAARFENAAQVVARDGALASGVIAPRRRQSAGRGQLADGGVCVEVIVHVSCSRGELVGFGRVRRGAASAILAEDKRSALR